MSVEELLSLELPPGFPEGNKRLRQVLQRLAEFGPEGATDNELIASFAAEELTASTVRPRRIDLTNMGLVVDAGLKRNGSEVRALSNATMHAMSPSFDQATFASLASAEGKTLAQLAAGDERRVERLRVSLAQLARIGRRAAETVGVELEETITDAADAHTGVLAVPQEVELTPPPLAYTGAGSIFTMVRPNGLLLGLRFKAHDDIDDEGHTATRRRVRDQARSEREEVAFIFERLGTEGWQLSPTPAAGDEVATGAEWFDALGEHAETEFLLYREWSPTQADSLGYDIAQVMRDFVLEIADPLSRLAAMGADPADELVQTLYWHRARAEALVALTERSRQLLFAGPPGTGKTFAARALARAMGGSNRARIVQFHPTYAYEDFVEGIRPVLVDLEKSTVNTMGDDSRGEAQERQGQDSPQLGYELRRGVLREVAEDAERAEDRPVFLIIDELNRANLPRVLGELLFALEYRGPGNEVVLPYSGDEFALPPNLWIVGTMNTADRSVALIDAAMHRRFKQVRFPVDYEALEAWHADHTTVAIGEDASARLRLLNERLLEVLDADRLVGHSYLMRDDLETVGWQAIWDEDLEPVLHDHLLGQLDELVELHDAFVDAD